MNALLQTNEWLTVLGEACGRTSQSRVAAKLRQVDGFPSATVINQVLKSKYPGRTDRLQALVEGVYMNHTCNCPVVGDITTDQCEAYQVREFAATNPTRVRLYQSCRNGCLHSRIKEEL
ncbi:MAG: XRE family transcriptional regulator [Candidatus Sedimenticola sp. (ex Thyasira tokunagai)]